MNFTIPQRFVSINAISEESSGVLLPGVCIKIEGNIQFPEELFWADKRLSSPTGKFIFQGSICKRFVSQL